MKLDVKKVDDIKRELKFEIPKERVSRTLDEVYKQLSKVVKIKGFRQGKVPRHVLESSHAGVAQEELIRKIIPEVYHEGISQQNLSPIDSPDIADVSYKDGIVKFTAKLEVKPEVRIKDYKGIKVKRKSSEVTDEEINKTLEFFKQGQGKDKEVTIDDAFARGLGYPSLDDFKKSLSRQLEMDKDRQNKMDVEKQIIDELLKRAKLSVPSSLVRKQTEHRLHHMKDNFKKQGMGDDDIKKKIEESKNELKGLVEKDVKVYLILDKIGQEKNIQVKEGENLAQKVMEFLLKEATWT